MTGYTRSDVELPAADGTILRGWVYRPDAATVEAPAPGVVMMFASVSSLSKNSQLPTPSGVLHQIYGLFTAPYTVNPAASRPSLITRALLR